MHRLYDIYQKDDTNKNYKAWKKSHDYWNTLWNKANLYDWNIQQTIYNKKGTLYFLMVKNQTTVRLYFDSTRRYVPCYLQIEGRDSDNSFGDCTGAYMVMGDNMYEKLKPGIDYLLEEDPSRQIVGDYYVLFSDQWIHSYTEVYANRDKWEVLTKDTVMKDANAAVFVYYNNNVLFPLNWVDRGKVIRTDMLKKWEALPAPPEPEEYPGYVHSFYSWTKDNGDNLMTNSRMDPREVTYTLTWHAAPQTITWVVDGESWTTSRNTDSLITEKWPIGYRGKDWRRWDQSLEKEGYTLTWKIKIGDQEGEFNPAMKTPAGGATVTAVYTVNSYNVVWKDGDTVVKEETLEFGAPLNAPALDAPAGAAAVWQLDGKDLAANATMPGRDITILSARHTHDWAEDRLIKAANCNTEGQQQYKCTICAVTKTEPIPIIQDAHNWYRRGYSIANCKSPQIDHYTCLNCSATKDVEVGEKDSGRHIGGSTTVTGVAATCGQDGRYAAVYCNDCGQVISGGGVIPATGNHQWTVTPNPAATCTTDGNWDYLCSVCGATKQEVAPAIGHDWYAPSYSWSDDLKTATATRICKNDGTHKEEETVQTTTELITPATCTSVGQMNYYAVFSNPAFEQRGRSEDIEMIPHIWGEPTYTWSDDLKTVTAKRVCQYDTNESHPETEVSNVQSSITKEPTCEATGIRTYTAIFGNSAFRTQIKEEVVPAKGHVWGAPTYEWADGNGSVTASHTCTVDGSHTDSETVVTTTSNRVEPTCETAGSLQYNATFTKDGFTTQTRTVTLAAKGHAYGDPIYTWAEDYSTVAAEVICANDTSHKINQTVVTTSEITKPATFEEMGETTYTATFTNSAFTTQTKTVANIDKVPEGWTSTTYTWSDDFSKVTASRTRTNDNFVQSETVDTVWAITTPATCENKGFRTYTSKEFENPVFAVQTKVVDNVPALGHAWSAVAYTWADDYSTVTARRVCGNDATHVESEEVAAAENITQAADCQHDGTAIYTGEFTNPAFTDQTKTVTLPADPDAHVFTTVTKATYIEDPIIEGAQTLVGGRIIKVCSVCGIEEVIPTDPIEPKLGDDQLDFYSITNEDLLDPAAGKTLQDVMNKLEDQMYVYISAAANPDGTGSSWATISAELTWAENYSNVLLSDLDQQFTANPDLKYKVKVHIKPTYFVSYDGEVYEGQLGSQVYGSLDDLKEVTVDLELIAHTHNWEWKQKVAHTDTEQGYDEYECSICHAVHKEYYPAGHTWQVKDWLDDGELPMDRTYAYRSDSGPLEDEHGDHYDLHVGGMRYYCPICNAQKEEATAKISFENYYSWSVMNTELIAAGYETVWDVDPSRYMFAVYEFELQNGDDIELLVPGTFTWAVGQQSKLKSTTLESLKDPDVYQFAATVTFTPENTEVFEAGDMTFVIENWYHEYNHEEHKAQATFEYITSTVPRWDPSYNQTGGWVGGTVYARCSLCGKDELDHYILLPAYVANLIDGTVTAGTLPEGTKATITVTTEKLIQLFGDQTVGYLLDNKRCNYSAREPHPWYEFFTVFYSDDGTLSGTHCDVISHGYNTGYVQFTSDVSTLPRDTKFSELTSSLTIEFTTYINVTNYAPVALTLVIQP